MSSEWTGTRAGEPRPVQLSDESACLLLSQHHLTADPMLAAQLCGFVSALAVECATLSQPQGLKEALAKFCRWHLEAIRALPKIEQHSEKSVEHQNKP